MFFPDFFPDRGHPACHNSIKQFGSTSGPTECRAIYHGPSQVYCIKPEGRIHECIKDEVSTLWFLTWQPCLSFSVDTPI